MSPSSSPSLASMTVPMDRLDLSDEPLQRQPRLLSSSPSSSMAPPHPEWVKEEAERIMSRLYAIYDRMRDGDFCSNQGPYFLGTLTEAGATDLIDRVPEQNCPLGTLRRLVDGVEVLDVYLYADPAGVHARLKRHIQARSFDPKISRASLVAQEHQILTAIGRLITSTIDYESGITEELRCRRFGSFREKLHRPGWVLKQPDGLWTLPIARLPQRINHQHPQGHVCAALEVVWRNEEPKMAFFEGLLWSGIGNLEEPVVTAANAMVLCCTDVARYVGPRGPVAFVVLVFAAADAEGKGRIEAHFLNASPLWTSVYQEVFDFYQSSLHEAVQVFPNVNEVSLTYGFFSSIQLAEVWRDEPFVLTWTELSGTYEAARAYELARSQDNHRRRI